MKKLLSALRGAAPYLAILALLAGAVGAATQTNYLGTVFIADPTTPTQQLAINADGSLNTKTGGQSFAVCFTLGTAAATKTCPPVGAAVASSTAAAVNEGIGRNTTFTDIWVSLTAAPTSTNQHVFTLVVNGSTTNAPTCTITGAATTCHGSGGTIAGTGGQPIYIQDVITGTPAASNAIIGTAWIATN